MWRQLGLPAITFVAIIVAFGTLTGLGLWKLLDEREKLLQTRMLDRQETLGRVASALASSVDDCWRETPKSVPPSFSDACSGIAEDSSPFRWLPYVSSSLVTGLDAQDKGTLDRLLDECTALNDDALFDQCIRAAEALSLAVDSSMLQEAGGLLLERIGPAAEVAPEYRRLAYRLLQESFAVAIAEQSPLLEKTLAEEGGAWARMGRFLVTKQCKAGASCDALIGLDAEPSLEAIVRFLNAKNISGATHYEFSMISEEQARLSSTEVSTAFLSPGLGYLMARDKKYPVGLANLQLLLGVYITAALLLMGSLFAALLLLDSRARDLRQKHNFVASVSHELRSPLGSVRLMLETILLGRLPKAKETRYLESMHQQVVRLSRLAENMLLFLKVERTTDLRFQPHALATLLNAAADELREEADRKSVNLDLDLGDGREMILAVPDLLMVAFQNLIHNAIKHSPPRGRVVATLERRGTWVMLHLRDQGPGIPARERGRVFEWFYRLGDELTRQSEGTGIGLPIVRAIANTHKGTVAFLEPDSNWGCHVMLSLPLLPDLES